MNVLIVEDEALLSRRLKSLLLEINPGMHIQGITTSVKDTLQWLQEHPAPDLMLMDIELGDGRSFDVLRQTNVDIPVIFITAYDEFAIQAFKVNSIDYLLKPVKKEELKAALEKFEEYLQRKDHGAGMAGRLKAILELLSKPEPGYRERFLIKKGQKMISVETENIACLMVYNTLNYILTFDRQKYIVEYSMDELENMLDPSQFFRANRQFIISRKMVSAIHPDVYSKLKIETSIPLDTEIIISRDKAKEFKEWMGQ